LVRYVLAMAAMLAILPVAGTAQMTAGREGPGPRLRVTPFIGYAPALKRVERRAAFSILGPESDIVEVEHSDGLSLGLNGEYRLANPLALMVGGGVIFRGRSAFASSTHEQQWSDAGSNFAFARIAAVIRLQEAESDLQMRRMNAALFAGPTYLRELPVVDFFRGTAEGMDLIGVVMGGSGEFPLGSGLALHFGAENTVFWWDNRELARRADAYNDAVGRTTTTAVSTGVSHQWVLRTGLSISR
jgi:hypothetical protein